MPSCDWCLIPMVKAKKFMNDARMEKYLFKCPRCSMTKESYV